MGQQNDLGYDEWGSFIVKFLRTSVSFGQVFYFFQLLQFQGKCEGLVNIYGPRSLVLY